MRKFSYKGISKQDTKTDVPLKKEKKIQLL